MDDFLKEQIQKRLKRTPNDFEYELFGAMWSEHCGYLHSKKQLDKLNQNGAIFAQENAGGVKIGDWGVFFKSESHNHPCAVEPYQGAATGMGGIIRDVLALNARPVALLNSLKFSPSGSKKSLHIINGVVSGISDYGNSCGIANVAGEVLFDECYENSPLVNVMAVGIAPLNKVKLSAAKEGLKIVVLGSNTGLDGVGGAEFASKNLAKNASKDKIHVQIGDPFLKKVLIEATLEILEHKGVVACQDCGAAGLLSSTSEMAYKGKCSVELDLSKLHLAQENIQPWQIMLSETQERMVFALEDSMLDTFFKIAEKYELSASCIGHTKSGGNYIIKWGDELLANLPLNVLCEPYYYDLEPVFEPSYISEYKNKVFSGSCDVSEAVYKLVCSPEFASKKWFYEQWDYSVGARTYFEPSKIGAQAVNFYENNCFLGMCMDSKPRKCFLDPYFGCISTFMESFRNLVSSGFKPLGVTDCLNFANPKNDEVKFQFVKSIEGLAEVSKKTKIPVVSGNVSFYNETKETRVYPTVTLGMVGVCPNEEDLIFLEFSLGDEIVLIGKQIDKNSPVGGSLYQKVLFDFLGSEVDKVDIDFELKLAQVVGLLKKQGFIEGAKDVSTGGVLGALLISLFASNLGFIGNLLPLDKLSDSYKLKYLFGEIEGRYLISTKDKNKLFKILEENNIPYLHLGKCFGDKIKFDGYEFDLIELKKIYENSLGEMIEDV